MGGDNSVTLVVLACPPEQVRAAVEVMADHGLSRDYLEAVDAADRHIYLGASHGVSGVYGGSVEEISAALVQRVPGATFYVWCDPDSEGLGLLHAYIPDLGVFTGECDNGGEPVYRRSDLIKTADCAGTAAVRELTGGAWFDVLDPLIESVRRVGWFGTGPALVAEAPMTAAEEEAAAEAARVDAETEDLAHELNGILHRVTAGTE